MDMKRSMVVKGYGERNKEGSKILEMTQSLKLYKEGRTFNYKRGGTMSQIGYILVRRREKENE